MELMLYFSGIVLLAIMAFIFRKRSLQIAFASIFLIWQSVFLVFLYKNPQGSWFNYFYNDSLATIFIFILTVTSVFTVINSFIYFKHRNEKAIIRSIYFLAMILFFGCMTGVFLSNNANLLWILTEATTLAIAVLIYHERTVESLEATWKYVFVSTIGLSFSFIGIILLDMSLQNLAGMNLIFNQIGNNIVINNKVLFQIAFLLIIIGFSVKMGVFPLHTVCIDAHSVAPSPVSALISTSLMNVGFVAIFRFYKIAAGTSLNSWASHVLYIIGFLSILYAAIYMIRVKNYKRLVAYSSIEHMGLVAIGIATGGLAWFAAILHLFYHSFTKSSLFFQLSQLIHMYKTKKLVGVGMYFKLNPLGGIVFLLAFILILGIPPSGMFFTELMLFKTMINQGLLWLVIIILLLLTIIIWMFTKQLFRMLFKNISSKNIEHITPSPWYESLPQLILLLFTLYISINPPSLLISFIHQAIMP